MIITIDYKHYKHHGAAFDARYGNGYRAFDECVWQHSTVQKGLH